MREPDGANAAMVDAQKLRPTYLLYVTSKWISADHWANISWTGVHAAEAFVLLELWREQPLSQKELGRRLDVTHVSIGETLRRLERNGLIERSRAPEDKRIMMVRLSPRGADLREPLIAQTREREAEVESVLGAKDTAELVRILTRLSSHYRAKAKRKASTLAARAG